MKDPGRVLVLGAGPTGLGAAHRLQELGIEDFTVLEGRDSPGGLASSKVDPEGFTWDIGGHVQFSHYGYYDAVLDRSLGDQWLEHERESWIWVRGRFVPYPFQNNLHRLPPGDRDCALQELEQAVSERGSRTAANFREWIDITFGRRIAELFLVPYNEKVWGYALEALSTHWMGERVAIPDLERVRRNVRENRDDVAWGPNHRFRFPLRGGTGAIWQAVADRIEPGRIAFDCTVAGIDLDRHIVRLADGRELRYDTLISSLPLDGFCGVAEGLDVGARRAAAQLVHSSVHILGVGLRGGRPASLRSKCWMYFPEPHSPYYRVTVFSNYSPHNVPAGEDHWSLMAEVCETPRRPVNAATLPARTLAALRQDGLIEPGAQVVSLWQRREEHGYPTPFVGRDEVLDRLLPALRRRRVYSRGRFGAWKYEVSNQDHSFMQGVEAVGHALGLEEEVTLERPGYVNGGALLGPNRG